jgi:hypothetical protein
MESLSHQPASPMDELGSIIRPTTGLEDIRDALRSPVSKEAEDSHHPSLRTYGLSSISYNNMQRA